MELHLLNLGLRPTSFVRFVYYLSLPDCLVFDYNQVTSRSSNTGLLYLRQQMARYKCCLY